MNTAGKKLGLGVANALGLMAMARRRCGSLPRILAYHGAEPEPNPVLNYDGFHVPAEVLRRQLEHLASRYRVVPLRDIVAATAEGRATAEHAVALTFDDGYLNNSEIVAPMLEAFGFPATFFVATGFVDGTSQPWWDRLRRIIARTSRPALEWDGASLAVRTPRERVGAAIAIESQCRSLLAAERAKMLDGLASSAGVEGADGPEMMTWNDVRLLLKKGFDVGPHTVSHISLGIEGAEAVARELAESARQLAAQTGLVPRTCSYPYGGAMDVPAGVERGLRELGFLGAVTSTEGLVLPGCDVFRLPRLNVTGMHDGLAFESLVSGFTTWVK